MSGNKDHFYSKLEIVIGILSLVGVLFLFAALKNGNLFAALCGIMMLMPLMITLWRNKYGSKAAVTKQSHEAMQDLKRHGNKVQVSLTNYVVKSNSWTEEVIDDNSRYIFLNTISGNSNANIRNEDRVITFLDLFISYDGKEEEFNFYFNRDSETLRMLLEVQKETYLYFDTKDSKKKYLDLEFLES